MKVEAPKEKKRFSAEYLQKLNDNYLEAYPGGLPDASHTKSKVTFAATPEIKTIVPDDKPQANSMYQVIMGKLDDGQRQDFIKEVKGTCANLMNELAGSSQQNEVAPQASAGIFQKFAQLGDRLENPSISLSELQSVKTELNMLEQAIKPSNLAEKQPVPKGPSGLFAKMKSMVTASIPRSDKPVGVARMPDRVDHKAGVSGPSSPPSSDSSFGA